MKIDKTKKKKKEMKKKEKKNWAQKKQLPTAGADTKNKKGRVISHYI